MGMVFEGVLRWDRVLPPPLGDAAQKPNNGKGTRKGDPREGWGGRNSAMLSACWDEWEESVKEKVDKVMGRRM
jgi:hypothetical protein